MSLSVERSRLLTTESVRISRTLRPPSPSARSSPPACSTSTPWRRQAPPLWPSPTRHGPPAHALSPARPVPPLLPATTRAPAASPPRPQRWRPRPGRRPRHSLPSEPSPSPRGVPRSPRRPLLTPVLKGNAGCVQLRHACSMAAHVLELLGYGCKELAASIPPAARHSV